MKRNVLVFGGIAGLIVGIWMILTIGLNHNNPNFEHSMWMGYGSMLVAFSFIFVGIKNYRDKYNGGYITFGQAFKNGLFIALIGSTMYVLTWLVLYYCFMPDFMDKYVAHTMAQMQKSGASATELADTRKQMAGYQEMYKNPLMVIVLTYMEILPVGLVIALLAALILKRKPAKAQGVAVA
ncbi:DUF4199 domain-containing protein [Mucilaginibacter mali]|uniref:DUF4199 domain-containing protein n=1 Tax=Mucilaginibacter mali TaxID=2740462 RepID=A0A7D4UER3_9SPHI|nr:DUF4199 domain-containing protein [Mucilaginibacter mali]QKJ29256.1 DUF4199 domain-containing protein [Mucilaginibacter mali]